MTFVHFVSNNKSMQNALRKQVWAAFACAFNGKGYKENNYDTKSVGVCMRQGWGACRAGAATMRRLAAALLLAPTVTGAMGAGLCTGSETSFFSCPIATSIWVSDPLSIPFARRQC